MKWAAIAGVVAFTAFSLPTVTPDDYPTEWKGRGQGRTYVLYRRHDVTEMSQGGVGSCVGCATSKALELMHGMKFSPEWCYGISRKHFDQHWSPYGGSFCAWAAQAMKDVGALPALNYSLLDEDLRVYDEYTAKRYERGPPESLEVIADAHKIAGFVQITTWEQFRGAIATGHPVIVGSDVGYGKLGKCVRSKSGMLKSQWWSKWSHAMVFCGVSDGRSKRALLLNSWGKDWIRGPKWLGDEPDGSF
ncbi:MAG: hypothetical protein GY906_22960, partial [bacterium]|nr:hypothetical protein [bacterium]